MEFRKTRRWVLAASIASLISVAGATENGVSVYPAGVETIMPGSGDTLFLEFNNFYDLVL